MMILQNQPRQKSRPPSKPIKAEHGGVHLSAQLQDKYKEEDSSPAYPEHEREILLKST
jgi:hypothetical protein